MHASELRAENEDLQIAYCDDRRTYTDFNPPLNAFCRS